MPKLVIANWKMNPPSIREAVALARLSDYPNVVIAAPFVFLSELKKNLKHATLGAQDVFWEQNGPYTGEVSPAELFSLGVKYAIIGHSERRRIFGESDAAIGKKIAAAVSAGLTPILCVGENSKERDKGRSGEVIERQLKNSLKALSGRSDYQSKKIIIVYEPVWAISTESGAEADTPENAKKMIELIRKVASGLGLEARIIYGGSVDDTNAEGFLREKEIEGALVGGASLKPEKIRKIAEIARNY